MKTTELNSKSVNELAATLAEKRAELAEKHRSNAAGELANPRSIKQVRRDIALLLTVINQRTVAAAAKEEANG